MECGPDVWVGVGNKHRRSDATSPSVQPASGMINVASSLSTVPERSKPMMMVLWHAVRWSGQGWAEGQSDIVHSLHPPVVCLMFLFTV